jgi:hypothetical protein
MGNDGPNHFRTVRVSASLSLRDVCPEGVEGSCASKNCHPGDVTQVYCRLTIGPGDPMLTPRVVDVLVSPQGLSGGTPMPAVWLLKVRQGLEQAALRSAF